ncbi:glutathione S-transferase family protein [Celeribacter sp.]|uniref:glutathione S-transferase family protein n=1 Tax=Celeribacter sp. TaxID=1890673 RepID=UPI003A94B9C0
MLTLYHSPMSRSTRVLALINALNLRDEIEIVTVVIKRQDGSGHHDPANPHPEGKVPLLVTEDGEQIRESNAIMLYLTDRFGSCGRGVGAAGRGAYLSWMTWYGNVFEPVYVIGVAHKMAAEMSGEAPPENPVFTTTWRTIPDALAVLETALSDGRPFLMGEDMTAADLLICSTYFWFGAPDVPVVAAWVARCAALECVKASVAFDEAQMAKQTAR